MVDKNSADTSYLPVAWDHPEVNLRSSILIYMKKISLILTALVFTLLSTSKAQPFLLKSIGENKSFSFKIYYGIQGKGAFVQYTGQQGIIPLRVKSAQIDRTDDSVHYTTIYVWDEMLNGKINGSYGLSEGLRFVDNAWYLRSKDNKKFKLQHIDNKAAYDGSDKYYLHNTLIEFNHFYNDRLIFRYPDKKVTTLNLPGINSESGARQSHIADYNFDGYDDIAFSVADAGMGVYQEYAIYLFDPKSRQFHPIQEPNYAKANCSCLCDVVLDSKRKLFYTSCRGGAKWWQEVWQFKNGKLVWLRSEEKRESR